MRSRRSMRILIPLMREAHFFIIALHWGYTSHIGRIPLRAVTISLDAWSNPYPWTIYCDFFPDDFDSNGYWRSYGYSLGHLNLYMVALSYLWAMAWIMAVVVTDHLVTLGNRSLLVDLHVWELGTSGILCSFVSDLILSLTPKVLLDQMQLLHTLDQVHFSTHRLQSLHLWTLAEVHHLGLWFLFEVCSALTYLSVVHLEDTSVFFSKTYLSWYRTCGLNMFLRVSFQLHYMKKQCFKSSKMKIDFYILSEDVSPNIRANLNGDLVMFGLTWFAE